MTKFNERDAVSVYLSSYLVMLILSLPLTFIEGSAKVYLNYLAPQIAYISITLVFLRYRKERFANIAPLNPKAKPIAYPLTFLTTAGIYSGFMLIAVSFDWLNRVIGINYDVQIPAITDAASYIITAVVLCLLPAIGEELIFRGVFVSVLEKKGERYAIFVSALVFALSHLNFSQLVYQFFLGIVLAFIVIRTKNIVFTMLIHFFNNLFVITLPLLIENYNSIGEPSGVSVLIMAVMAVVGAAILYPSLYFLVKYGSKDKQESGNLNFFKIFGKNSKAVCYNEQVIGRKNITPVMVLIIILTVALLINTLLSVF